MNIREEYENLEEKILSPYASLSKYSKGRRKKEEKCEIRTEYQRDRDRIIHSRAFRRLKHKTQVFISPDLDHYRTRLTHTLEVSQISRTVARALRLNEDLTETIALGHDLGHTPFGHIGEEVLNKICQEYNPRIKFSHARQSLRVVDLLENEGRGLNLTYEVRDGILHHTKGRKDLDDKGILQPSTLEGRIVMICDRIAYINHDIADAIRAGIIKGSDIPSDCVNALGKSQAERIDVLVKDIIKNSMGKNNIFLSEEKKYYLDKLKEFLFNTVYCRVRDEKEKIEEILRCLFDYYLKNQDQIKIKRSSSPILVTCDYISGMTDNYAILQYKKICQ